MGTGTAIDSGSERIVATMGFCQYAALLRLFWCAGEKHTSGGLGTARGKATRAEVLIACSWMDPGWNALAVSGCLVVWMFGDK
jgi:hypothetical protein